MGIDSFKYINDNNHLGYTRLKQYKYCILTYDRLFNQIIYFVESGRRF